MPTTNQLTVKIESLADTPDRVDVDWYGDGIDVSHYYPKDYNELMVFTHVYSDNDLIGRYDSSVGFSRRNITVTATAYSKSDTIKSDMISGGFTIYNYREWLNSITVSKRSNSSKGELEVKVADKTPELGHKIQSAYLSYLKPGDKGFIGPIQLTKNAENDFSLRLADTSMLQGPYIYKTFVQLENDSSVSEITTEQRTVTFAQQPDISTADRWINAVSTALSFYSSEIYYAASKSQNSFSIAFDPNTIPELRVLNGIKGTYNVSLGTLKAMFGSVVGFYYGGAKDDIDFTLSLMSNVTEDTFELLPTYTQQVIKSRIQQTVDLINSNDEIKSALELSGYTSVNKGLGLLLGKGKNLEVLTVNKGYILNNVTLDVKLLDELSKNGVKFSSEKMLRIAKTSDGKIVFLEEGFGGEKGRGLAHIIEGHAQDFFNNGISIEQIPDAIMTAITKGKIIGKLNDKIVFECIFNGQTKEIAVLISDNGYIVTAFAK